MDEKVEKESNNDAEKENLVNNSHQLRSSNEHLSDLHTNIIKHVNHVSSSHGDLQMKSSVGTANLLNDNKLLLARKEVQETKHRSYSGEIVLKVNKRKKRLPTKENAIHVLEVCQFFSTNGNNILCILVFILYVMMQLVLVYREIFFKF